MKMRGILLALLISTHIVVCIQTSVYKVVFISPTVSRVQVPGGILLEIRVMFKNGTDLVPGTGISEVGTLLLLGSLSSW